MRSCYSPSRKLPVHPASSWRSDWVCHATLCRHGSPAGISTRPLAGIDHQIVPRAMGYPMTAYVTARIDQHQLEAIGAALADVPEVVQVHGLAGADDLMIKVVAVDSDDLYRIAGNILDIPVLPDVDRHRHARAGCVPDDAAAAAPLRAGIGPSPASPEPLRPSRIAAYCPKARQ